MFGNGTTRQCLFTSWQIRQQNKQTRFRDQAVTIDPYYQLSCIPQNPNSLGNSTTNWRTYAQNLSPWETCHIVTKLEPCDFILISKKNSSGSSSAHLGSDITKASDVLKSKQFPDSLGHREAYRYLTIGTASLMRLSCLTPCTPPHSLCSHQTEDNPLALGLRARWLAFLQQDTLFFPPQNGNEGTWFLVKKSCRVGTTAPSLPKRFVWKAAQSPKTD